MSLSRLLLVAVSSNKYIRGEGEDRVEVKPKDPAPREDPFSGEVVLCFQLDDRKNREKRTLISRSLDLQDTDQRCDGLIFYAQDGKEEKVICLVEMKSTNIRLAAEQIKSTREHIKELLRKECETSCNKQLNNVKWKACFYHHSASIEDIGNELKQLRRAGFDEYDDFTKSNNNVGPLLRSEGGAGAKELAKKIRWKKRSL